VRICAIGWRAETALRESGGEARVLAVLSTSVYVDVAGAVLWLGAADTTPHARAIGLAAIDLLTRSNVGDVLCVPAVSGVRAWRPANGPTTPDTAATLRRAAARLAARVALLGAPRGFGAWLAGAAPNFAREAGARADALARACAADDAPGAAAAATTLVGLGPGLTPAGDDFVGGAFFARALLARAGALSAVAWDGAASAVETAAARLTHPIGAALLGDLLHGEGWAPLHDLAAALASDDEPAGLDAARRLTRLGHSSGWDLLAGFVAGARG